MLIVPEDLLRGLAGGLLIGCAGALLLLLNGRIAGVSGILGLALSALPAGPKAQAAAFLTGLIGVPVLWGMAVSSPVIGLEGGSALLIGAGLLVGIGTRLGSGCTSGHGVCGLSRASGRSLAAVLTFMGVAVLVASVLRPALGG